MTDREKELIAAYIPSPRDESLESFEYYVKDMNDRIQKVEITDICLLANGETVYLVVQAKTRKKIKGWHRYDGFTMGFLYDNKQDCRDGTHDCYSYWETLREIEQKEAHTEIYKTAGGGSALNNQ